MAYNDDLAIIVRYDGTKENFEKVKGDYKGKVVFIYGSKTEVENQQNLVQAIWVSGATETSGRYLDMTNIESIKSELSYIAGLAIDGEAKTTEGGKGINLIGANGISISIEPTNLVDINGVSYYNVKVDGLSIIGTEEDADTAITLYGIKRYAKNQAENVRSALIGNSENTSENNTLYGARAYARDLIEGLDNNIEESLSKKADLENGKILESQLPDYILGQLLFGGTIQAGGANMIEVTPSTKLLDKLDKASTTESLTIMAEEAGIYEGAYFIVTGGLTSIFGFSVVVGDWIISTGTDWRKVDNTDAVVSVAGLTGPIEAKDLADKLSDSALGNSALATKNELNNSITNNIGIRSTTEDFISAQKATSNGIATFEVGAKTSTIEGYQDDSTQEGLATVSDIDAYLSKRLSVLVVGETN